VEGLFDKIAMLFGEKANSKVHYRYSK